jgi:hypothetical protein
MNLLPYKVRLRLATTPRIRAWCLTLCASAVAGSAWFFCEFENLNRSRQALARLEDRAHPLQQMVRDRNRIQHKLAETTSRESILSSLDANRTPLAYLAIVGQAAQNGGNRLHVTEMHVETKPEAPAGDVAAVSPVTNGSKPPGPEQASLDTQTEVLLTGAAIDDLAVAAFVRGLRDSEAFDDVELKSSREATARNGSIRHYEVQCIRR